ncbi:MAG TPA: M23 family metallopeptidase [Pyrinomonadaceae bacterium]|nr:M23 family metallopeptidase [Pyrinomonadaceae bacterium]
MTEIILTVVTLQLIVPLILLVWQWRERSASRAQWLLKTVLVIAHLTALAVAGLWSWIPFFVPYLFLILSLALAIRGWFRVRYLPFGWAETTLEKIKFSLTSLLATFACGLAVYAFSGWQVPEDYAADLVFPLKDGTFYVASGGSNSLVNPHLNTLEGERFRTFRGQSYAVDIMQINRYGLRANGFLPADPAQYAIFGTPVYAPCDGTVVQTENSREDMPPPLPDRAVMPGNHVLLDCGEFIVLLAHFKKGSVAVEKGQTIETGQMLGLIGNSGNTNEPHLHIHAQRRGADEMPLGGEPLWMTFAGKFLVRNQLVVR